MFCVTFSLFHLFYNWRFVPFNSLHLFLPTSRLWPSPVWFLRLCFCFVWVRTRGIYRSLSVSSRWAWHTVHAIMSTQVTVFLKLFIYLAVPGLVASRGLQLPDQGPNPSPLHGERRVLATEPPGKSQDLFFNGWMIFCSMYTTYSLSMCLLMDVGYFHFLLFVNSTAVNKWVNASFWINVIIFFK